MEYSIVTNKLPVGTIIRRKRDGFEFEILEVTSVGYTCRDINHRLTWVFVFEKFEQDFEKVFNTVWGQKS